MLAASYPFLDVMWTMFVFFLWVLWFILLFRVFGDIFRRHDLSGGAKAALDHLHEIILPFLGVFIYIISQGDAMAKRDLERAQAQRAQFDDYVRETAGGGGAASEIANAKVAARQRRHHPGRVRRNQAEGVGLAPDAYGPQPAPSLTCRSWGSTLRPFAGPVAGYVRLRRKEMPPAGIEPAHAV